MSSHHLVLMVTRPLGSLVHPLVHPFNFCDRSKGGMCTVHGVGIHASGLLLKTVGKFVSILDLLMKVIASLRHCKVGMLISAPPPRTTPAPSHPIPLVYIRGDLMRRQRIFLSRFCLSSQVVPIRAFLVTHNLLLSFMVCSRPRGFVPCVVPTTNCRVLCSRQRWLGDKYVCCGQRWKKRSYYSRRQ